jgi:hypothetical protein
MESNRPRFTTCTLTFEMRSALEALFPHKEDLQKALDLGGYVAGGAVVHAYNGSPTSDIDVFFTKRKRMLQYARYLLTPRMSESILSVRNTSPAVEVFWKHRYLAVLEVLTKVNGKFSHPIQLIWVKRDGVESVLSSFDYDYVQMGVWQRHISEGRSPIGTRHLGTSTQTSSISESTDVFTISDWAEYASTTKVVRYLQDTEYQFTKLVSRSNKLYAKGYKLCRNDITDIRDLGVKLNLWPNQGKPQSDGNFTIYKTLNHDQQYLWFMNEDNPFDILKLGYCRLDSEASEEYLNLKFAPLCGRSDYDGVTRSYLHFASSPLDYSFIDIAALPLPKFGGCEDWERILRKYKRLTEQTPTDRKLFYICRALEYLERDDIQGGITSAMSDTLKLQRNQNIRDVAFCFLGMVMGHQPQTKNQAAREILRQFGC